ncbi:MAG: hypothetical protein ACRDK8_07190 [Solirubrobacteraceae bacterium]
MLALLDSLAPWADDVAAQVAGQLTDHHFAFAATAEFFDPTWRGTPSR